MVRANHLVRVPLTLGPNALGASQLATFILVTDTYRLGNFPLSLAAHSRLGMSNDSQLKPSWHLSMLVRFLVVPEPVELGPIHGHDCRHNVHWGLRQSG